MYLLLLGFHENHHGRVSVDVGGELQTRRVCVSSRLLEVDLVSGLKATKKGLVPLGGVHQAACMPLRTEGTMHLGRSPYGPKSLGWRLQDGAKPVIQTMEGRHHHISRDRRVLIASQLEVFGQEKQEGRCGHAEARRRVHFPDYLLHFPPRFVGKGKFGGG